MYEIQTDHLLVKVENYKPLRDIALDSIREAIVSGLFKPGYHIKERDIAKALGISTTPIKEALRMLSREGLIETVPRKGVFVSEYVKTSIEETIILRAYLEGLSANFAALKITDEESREMERQIARMRALKAKRNGSRLSVENTRFHGMIRSAAKNPMLSQLHGQVAAFDSAFRKRALRQEHEIEEGFAEHLAIFEAIRTRNPELAEERMKQHILRTAKDVMAGEAETET